MQKTKNQVLTRIVERKGRDLGIKKQILRNGDENGQREGTESIGGRSRGTRDTGGVPRF